MILPLVIAPDVRLNQRSIEVDIIDRDLQNFMQDMLETMYHEDGAGLAAVQVGVSKRIMIIDVDQEKGRNPFFMINPEILTLSEEKSVKNEGCLSFPDQRLEIERSSNLTVRYLDYHGVEQEIEADAWFARAILHELDHLNGITMPDHASRIKKDMMINRAKKIKKIIENNQ